MGSYGINPVFLLTIAILPFIGVVSSLNEIALLALITCLIYVLCICLISILEKLVDRNVRFFVFMILAGTIATVINYIYMFFPNAMFASAGEKIYFCAISAGILSLNLIYDSSKLNLSHYFAKMLVQVPCFFIMIMVFGLLREFLAFGTVWKIEMGLTGIEFFKTTSGAFMLLAFECGFINAFWLSYSNKKQQYNLLVAKYKMKINQEHNQERVDLVNASERENYGVDELISEKDKGEQGNE